MLGISSYFSLLRGVYSPEKLCAWAAAAGIDTIGIWDINNMYGLIRCLRAAREHGIKAIPGVRMELPGQPTMWLACRSSDGFELLCRLTTRALALSGKNRKPADSPVETACLPDILQDTRFSLVDELLRYGWNGLALITRDHETLARLSASDYYRDGSRADLYAGLVWGLPQYATRVAADQLGLPAIALSDGGSWMNEDDKQLLRVLRAIDTRIPVDDLPGAEEPQPHQCIPDPDSFLHGFHAAPYAVDAARQLALESEDSNILERGPVFPGFNDMDNDEALRHLAELCMQGAERRYGVHIDRETILARTESSHSSQSEDSISLQVERRLRRELSIIESKGFSSYFLIVHDIVTRCPRTCGRGSAAAGIVSYLLGITHVDPLRHNLFFERFLNEGRRDPPDIDVDFPWDERADTLRYVFEKYRGYAAMVADHVTFAARSAFRETAIAFGVDSARLREWTALREQNRSDGIPAQIIDTARRLYGIPRYLGTHPGGVVITPRPITCYTTIQMAPAGVPVIAWEKDAAEDAGLVKIDLLGNRSLAVLRDCIGMVRKNHGMEFTWEGLNPIGDPDTEQFIESGDTLGVFYIESPATRLLLQKMQHGDFEHVVVASSIIRPAANAWINEYIERLRGKPWGLWPSVDEVLAETYGVMVYQEDVSRIAIAVAGFSAAEADTLRKVLSRKDRTRRLEYYRDQFWQGCLGAGTPEAVIRELWDMILSFDGYSFCKSHSASYALVSYRLAYLKMKYPLEFFTAVLNNGGGFYAPQTYLHAAVRQGIPLLGPDVNRSEAGFSCDAGRIRFGLSGIRHSSKDYMERVLAERRQRGDFRDIHDFFRRTTPSYVEIRQFIRSGACDSLAEGYTRPQLFWLYIRSQHSCKQDQLIPDAPIPPNIGDYAPEVKLTDERAVLGMNLSRHPVISVRGELSRQGLQINRLIDSSVLSQYINMQVAVIGILVTAKEVLTKHRTPMQFITLEDEYGLIEVVLFPNVYREWIGKLSWGCPYIVTGRVIQEFSAISFQAEELHAFFSSDTHKLAVESVDTIHTHEGRNFFQRNR